MSAIELAAMGAAMSTEPMLGPFRSPSCADGTEPTRDERCTTCLGRWWWTERDAPRRGWRCWCCVPAPGGLVVAERET